MSVYLLDDDAGIRASMTWAFQSTGLDLRTYQSVDQLMADVSHDEPSCLILDLQLEGITGLECLNDPKFKEKLKMPVIILTGTGDVSDAVQSMKLGVIDFFEKPVQTAALINCVREALRIDAGRMRAEKERAKTAGMVNRLSDRERQIIALLYEGYSSKQIATKLGISANTVANHRACLRKKTQAANTAEMVRIAMLADAA